MQDILGLVMSLKRPKMLVNAAIFGVDDYARDRHLRRCLRRDPLPSPGQALIALLDIEKQLNSERTSRSGSYLIAKHVEILTAIMAEARSFRAGMATKPQRVPT